MTRKALLVLAVSSFYGILTAPLGAQSQRPVGRFDVPFEFSVNRKTMPAGKYTVRVDAVDGAVQIQSAGNPDGKQRLLAMTFPAGIAVGDQPRLTFHRYGDKYFLARISPAVGFPIRGLSVTPAEREVARSASPALQTVTLAALPPGR
jgi:hypothetical protein